MFRASIVPIAIAGFSLWTMGCSAGGATTTSASPAAPSSITPAGAPVTQSAAAAVGRTHGEVLTAVSGTGTGMVNVTPTADADGFSAEITVSVHDAPPDTDFYIQRAPEIGRANSADGICQRAMGVAPWGPPAPNFVTFPLPLSGPLVVLHTSEGGAGSAHISFALPSIADGTAFDVMFRLVDSLSAPSHELRTTCFTVTAR
jgi:hypothetical protein